VYIGMVAIINAVLLNEGKSSVGWMNPAIYANGTHFLQDIDSGNNKCTADSTGGGPTCCKHGFYSLKGWDPVTGMGSPYFPAMVEYFVYGNLSYEFSTNSAAPVISWISSYFFVIFACVVVWLA
jgi:hypothetical protein